MSHQMQIWRCWSGYNYESTVKSQWSKNLLFGNVCSSFNDRIHCIKKTFVCSTSACETLPNFIKKSIRAIMNLGAYVEIPKNEWSLFGVCSTTEGTYLQRETIIDTTVTPVVILLFEHNNVLLGIKKPICLIYIYMDIQLYQHNPIELRNPLCHYFNIRWNW